MAFEDLDLGGPGAPPPAPRRPPRASPARWIIVGAVAVIVGAVVYLWWLSRAQPGTATPVPTSATDVTVARNRPNRQPLELPPLSASDFFVRQAAQVLSRHPLLARLLGTQALVNNAVLAVEQIGDGKTPADPLRVLRPLARLTVLGGAGDTARLDPESYTRWRDPASALESIPPGEAAQVYVNLKQLFDQAYHDLGHPGRDFDEAIVRAIQMLASAPVLGVEPELLRRPGYFEHADPALRALPPVQKQLILMGPDNQRRVVGWLKRLARALDLKIE